MYAGRGGHLTQRNRGATIAAYTLIYYLLMSLVTFAMYASDKSAARAGRRRVPEANLLMASLLGGWPGGLIARHALRHKTRKQPFRTIFWVTVVLNLAGLAYVAAVAAKLAR